MLEREARLASSDVTIPIASIRDTITPHTGDLSSRHGYLSHSICHLRTPSMALKRHQAPRIKTSWAQSMPSKALDILRCLACLACRQTNRTLSTPCLR